VLSTTAAMTNAVPAISFVLPVFNVQAYLRKCLDSILNQTRTDFEIVIVDDGSTDGSLSICRDYANRDARVSVHSQENQGQGVARNRGVDIARGRYVCYVDPDDWLESRMAEELVPTMESSGADFANFRIDFITESGKVAHKLPRFAHSQLKGEEILKHAMIDEEVYTSPCNKIYSRDFLIRNNIKFPDFRAHGDIYYSRILSLHARSCIFIDKIYYHALIRAGSTSRRMDLSTILLAIKVIELERSVLIDHHLPSLAKNLFDAHVVKLMSYLLILAAYRIPDWDEYIRCSEFAATVNYGEMCRNPATLSYLRLRNRWIAKMAMHPFLVRVLAKVLTIFGIRPY
jgi:glycosyltransferase involved in cell wall biosynthesis